jgi:hypothetical protein
MTNQFGLTAARLLFYSYSLWLARRGDQRYKTFVL